MHECPQVITLADKEGYSFNGECRLMRVCLERFICENSRIKSVSESPTFYQASDQCRFPDYQTANHICDIRNVLLSAHRKSNDSGLIERINCKGNGCGAIAQVNAFDSTMEVIEADKANCNPVERPTDYNWKFTYPEKEP